MSAKQPYRKRSKDDGEKPFWISFSDLMTAMMVMFLVVMAVALLAITTPSGSHQEEIENWIKKLEGKIKSDFPTLTIKGKGMLLTLVVKQHLNMVKQFLRAPLVKF